MRNDNLSEGSNCGAQFGDSSVDEIHLVAESGYEDHFFITPNKFTNNDLYSGELEISVVCCTNIDRDISILAYHTDEHAAKTASGKINAGNDGKPVGELRVAKNDIKHTLDFVIVKVIRKNNTTDFSRSVIGPDNSDDLGPLKNIIAASKKIQRTYAQASIHCNVSVQNLTNCEDAASAVFGVTDYDHEKYKQYINNHFLYTDYNNNRSFSLVPKASFIAFENNIRNVRSTFLVTAKKRFLLFVHDYKNSKKTSLRGSADKVEEIHNAETGKWAVLYNNGSKSLDVAVHEAAHTLGLQHTFNIYDSNYDFYKVFFGARE